MSKADDMFKELGYEKEYMKIIRGKRIGENWGEKFVCEESYIEICFDYIGKEFCISTLTENESVYIGIEDLKAINEKVKELGWEE